MEDKIRIEEIKRYSKEFSLAVTDSFFKNKEKISGKEILSFCPVRQVNMLILYELMKTWTSETQKLKSPYFDYSSKPVQEALLQFQNTLSNHISIVKKDFVGLVEQAVRQTLSLIISPYDFYSALLDGHDQGIIGVAELRNEIKYLKINSGPLDRLLQKLTEEKKVERISGKETFAMLDGILEEVNFSPEDPEIYLSEFSKILKISLSNFYEPVAAAPAPSKKIVTTPPMRKPQPLPNQTTLYDQLSTGENKPTLADNFQKRKIAKLRDSLSINQKFMFTKMLFNGDFEIFSQTIERLDMLDSIDQAMRYFQNDFPEWDRESEEYQEFLDMMQKRFSIE